MSVEVGRFAALFRMYLAEFSNYTAVLAVITDLDPELCVGPLRASVAPL